MMSSCGRAMAMEEVYMRSVMTYGDDNDDDDGLETECQQFLPCFSRVCTVDKNCLCFLSPFQPFLIVLWG